MKPEKRGQPTTTPAMHTAASTRMAKCARVWQRTSGESRRNDSPFAYSSQRQTWRLLKVIVVWHTSNVMKKVLMAWDVAAPRSPS